VAADERMGFAGPFAEAVQLPWDEPERRKPKGGRMESIRSLPQRAAVAVTALRDREDGQAMVEYALLLFLVSIVSIAVLTLLGGSVSSVFSEINADI
jgi:pilus assembly protein Flp/PilA